LQILLQILFWVSAAAILHSYVLFPLIIRMRAGRLTPPEPDPLPEPAPFVSIIIAAFNEEQVIVEKLDSIFGGQYPRDRFEVLVGSDASTDHTVELVSDYAGKQPGRLQLSAYDRRRGKPNVVNDLVSAARGEILVLTDANVIFDSDTLNELIRPFADPLMGLVDTRMINMGMKREGISYQEKAYISREVDIKRCESTLWGSMMGPFGGCYAIRRSLYRPVPHNFLVDDFYLNMLVLESGFKAINRPSARVFEDVSNDLKIEYRRKVRIATGNFQNLARFGHMLWPPWSGRAFSFMSHKVMRWLGPHFMLLALASLVFLSFGSDFYRLGLFTYLGLLLLPLMDFGLKSVNLHAPILRFLTHFLAMNLAMGVGFIRYLKGVKSNVWQPTKRHQ